MSAVPLGNTADMSNRKESSSVLISSLQSPEAAGDLQLTILALDLQVWYDYLECLRTATVWPATKSQQLGGKKVQTSQMSKNEKHYRDSYHY